MVIAGFSSKFRFLLELTARVCCWNGDFDAFGIGPRLVTLFPLLAMEDSMLPVAVTDLEEKSSFRRLDWSLELTVIFLVHSRASGEALSVI